MGGMLTRLRGLRWGKFGSSRPGQSKLGQTGDRVGGRCGLGQAGSGESGVGSQIASLGLRGRIARIIFAQFAIRGSVPKI